MLRKLCIFAAVAAALFIAPAALPVTAMAIRVMAISMDMVTATSTAMSKTIGTIVSIGMLPSAVGGRSLVGRSLVGRSLVGLRRRCLLAGTPGGYVWICH